MKYGNSDSSVAHCIESLNILLVVTTQPILEQGRPHVNLHSAQS